MLSRARRDEEGRLLGRSTLLLGVEAGEAYLPRNRVPAHGLQRDRPADGPARGVPGPATGARRDGLLVRLAARGDHAPRRRPSAQTTPLIHAILERTQSASSLRMLLRNPLGFVWHYGLGWRAPESGDDPLMLDPLAMGILVHNTLERALRTLEMDGGLANASDQRIAAAVDGAAAEVTREWRAIRLCPRP